MTPEIKKWDIRSRRVTAQYRLFSIEEKQVRSPRTGADMAVQAIHFPDWVVVLPVTSDQTVIMVRQYRHGNEKICLELPGGLVDPEDESAEISARRELIEETGWRPQRMVPIGIVYPQPAVLSNRCHFFLARDVAPVGKMALDAGEDILWTEVPLADIRAKIRKGEIDNAMTVLAFSYYWMQNPAAGMPGKDISR